MGQRKKKTLTKKRNKESSAYQQLGTEDSGDDQVTQFETDARMTASSKESSKEDFSHVSVFNSPILSIKTLLKVLVGALESCLAFVTKNWIAFFVATIGLLSFIYVPLPGALNQQREGISDFCLFALYWIGLGIASSVGLGTGLHTFVLYLGPHIAKVVIAANECNRVPDMLPSRFTFDHFAPCKSVPSDHVTIGFWTIYQAVFLEAFLWGAGTAIGELPPYFVARAASAAGGIDEELEEVLGDDNTEGEESWVDRGKKKLAVFLKNYAFVTVLLMASIPNPLFDLAGLMCGHFQIPFFSFFIPTLIGKAVNKVSLQVIFLIVAFSKHIMGGILESMSGFAPGLAMQIEDGIDKQKTTLFKTQEELDAVEEPFIKTIWEWCITAMILYFVVTFFNALVRNQLEQDAREGKKIGVKKSNRTKV